MTDNIFHKMKIESDAFMKERNRRNSRNLRNIVLLSTIVASAFAATASILSPLIKSTNFSSISISNPPILLAMLALPILTLTITVTILRNSQKKIESISYDPISEEIEIERILSKIETLENRARAKEGGEVSQQLNTPEAHEKIIIAAANTYGRELIEEAKRTIEEEARERLENQKNTGIFQKIESRLLIEIENQKSKSKINLIIGILFATIGISALFYFLLTPIDHSTQESSTPIIEIIQRSSFVLLIEVLAYFFLNLHRREAKETRYYQNEITNIQLKLIASNLALDNGTNKSIIVNELAKSERNFILEKGQTTVDLEKEKALTKSDSEILKKISKLANADKKQKQLQT